jgi:hypothetical protein
MNLKKSTNMENLLFEATLKHYEAKEAEAKAILSVYFTNPVGIGEHSDLITEIRKHVELLDAAQGAIETLKRNFLQDEDSIDNLTTSVE